MAFQKKYDSATCSPGEVADIASAWDARGYQVEAMCGASSGQGFGHGPIVVILFKLRERSK